MAKWQERAALLFKEEGLNKLKKSNVLVVGLGGVGSFAVEFLVRAGVGKLTIVDGDTVHMYYGASDEVICGATFSISHILSTLSNLA